MTLTNEYIEAWLRERMSHPEYNNMKELPGFAFDLPSVGFSRATDEWYPFYKEHIGPDFYRLPQAWLESVYGRSFDPETVSVISWVLPQTEDTRLKSREKTDCPPLEWTMVRLHGEECNRQLAKDLETHLRELGFEAVAPMANDQFSWGESQQFVKISNWSERHTAFISGLGTFGLCDGLISKRGKAARYGSVIVAAKLNPTERTYTAWNEYCLAKNGCTACIRRCPAGAITEKGHDKRKCMEYQATVIPAKNKAYYNYTAYNVCGLCQTGVPCEWGIPGEKE